MKSPLPAVVLVVLIIDNSAVKYIDSQAIVEQISEFGSSNLQRQLETVECQSLKELQSNAFPSSISSNTTVQQNYVGLVKTLTALAAPKQPE